MSGAGGFTIRWKQGPMAIVAGVTLQALLVGLPMSCAAVVLYDIAVNGLRSPFAIIGMSIAAIMATFKAVFWINGKYEEMVENAFSRGRARREAAALAAQSTAISVSSAVRSLKPAPVNRVRPSKTALVSMAA